MTIFTFIFGVVVGVIIGRSFFKGSNGTCKKYLLVHKTTGDSRRTAGAIYESIHFESKIYPMPLPHLIDEEHFFVPADKLPSSVYNRTVIKETLPNGAINYDHNGYDSIPEKDMKDALTVVDQEAIML